MNVLANSIEHIHAGNIGSIPRWKIEGMVHVYSENYPESESDDSKRKTYLERRGNAEQVIDMINVRPSVGDVQPERNCLIALNESNDNVIGLLEFDVHDMRNDVFLMMLTWLLVNKETRGQGLGKLLHNAWLQSIPEISKRLNLKQRSVELLLAVHQDNKQAERLYRKLGYTDWPQDKEKKLLYLTRSL